MLENYKCVIASRNQIIDKWDEEIKRHNDSEEWKIYKEQSLNNMDTRIVYMGLLDGKIITEATAIISSKDKCPLACSSWKIGKIGHEPQLISAETLSGNARGKFSMIPPPVICAMDCTRLAATSGQTD